MRKGKGYVFALTVILLMSLLLCGRVNREEQGTAFYAELTTNESTEIIHLWEDAEGNCFFFIPSYGTLDQLSLRTNAPERFFIGGQSVEDGTSCSEFVLDKKYVLSDEEEAKQTSVTFVRSGNVATLYLDTSSGSMEYIHQLRGNEETGRYRLYTVEGNLVHRGSVSALKGRGNASWWGSEKKPYSLNLAVETDMLGLGRGRKWILLANSMDRTNVKNRAVFQYAREVGLAYSPDCEWVDLYLNGEYAGLYLLCERNEIHHQRVDVPKENTFLVSLELESRLISRGYPYIRTDAGQALRIYQQYMETEQVAQMWQSAENAILAPDSIDPVTGKHLSELIDLDSWVRKYLLEEVFANVDACSISQFFYTDGSGKIFAGPVWDYDGAMGSFVPESLFGNRVQACEGKPLPWFSTLYMKDFFIERVKELYKTEFRPLLLRLLTDDLAMYARMTAPAARMNLVRWSGMDPQTELQKVKAYMESRIAFLDNLWIEELPYCIVYADLGPDTNGVNYAVLPGNHLPELPGYSNSDTKVYHGWYRKDSNEPFDGSMPIVEDMEIYLKQTDLLTADPGIEALTESYDEAESEPISAVRLLPAVVFAGMLAVVLFLDFWKWLRREQKANSGVC